MRFDSFFFTERAKVQHRVIICYLSLLQKIIQQTKKTFISLTNKITCSRNVIYENILKIIRKQRMNNIITYIRP